MSSETVIVNKLVETILARGYSIVLAAEGEEFFGPSQNKDEILRNVDAATFMELYFHGGFFLIVWGNGEDIISDYTDNELCREIYAEVERATGI